MDLLIITLSVVVAFPAFVGLMSFVTWQNGFLMMGSGYIIRMTTVLVVFAWVIYFIPGGA